MGVCDDDYMTGQSDTTKQSGMDRPKNGRTKTKAIRLRQCGVAINYDRSNDKSAEQSEKGSNPVRQDNRIYNVGLNAILYFYTANIQPFFIKCQELYELNVKKVIFN